MVMGGADIGGVGLGRLGGHDRAAGCRRHPGSRVTRNGTASTASGRVQKYFCLPSDAPRHTFTEPVAGDGTTGRPPRGHRYDAAVIARALLALARGATYRQARITALGGQLQARPVPDGPVAPGIADAKLVSRWLDSFGPLLRRELASARTSSVAVAHSIPIGRPPASRGGRWLLCLAGSNPGEGPLVWPAILADCPDEAAWQALFRQSDGRPAVLLCQSPTQEAAAVRVWGPHLGTRAPSARSRPGTSRARALMWPAGMDGACTGPVMAGDLREARRVAGAADALVHRLARRAAAIRAMDRADVLVGLMALEVSGLATADSLTRIVRGR